MDPVDAAQAAGWIYWGFDIWTSTDLWAIADRIHPWRWEGTATDLCLAHAIDFVSPDHCRL